MSATEQVIDSSRIGRRGFPRHYQAIGVEPPMKTVPVSADGAPDFSAAPMTDAQIRAAQVVATKVECRRRILLIMTEDQQRNTLAAGQAALMQYGPDVADWPQELQERQQAALDAWAEISRLRARSNAIEAMGVIPADIADDHLWAPTGNIGAV